MKTILLLEDEPGIAEMLVIILELERYAVLAAANGLEALSTLKQNQADVILTDVMMPGMGGLEFCRMVRADPAHADIPIVFQTSVEEWAVREHFEDYDGFFLKPYNLTEMLARLEVLAASGRDLSSRPSSSGAEGPVADERSGFMPPDMPAA